jgi:hypothetical protein
MKRSLLNVLCTAAVICAVDVYTSAAADHSSRYPTESKSSATKSEKEELDSRTHAVNQAAKHGNLQAALHVISVETGVPKDQVESLHKDHPDAGPAAILNAYVMADETKGAPSRFLDENRNGKSWTAIARQNNVALEKFNDRLDHLERALQGER